MIVTRIIRFIGHAEYALDLSGAHIRSLEKTLDAGIGELVTRVRLDRYAYRDLIEIIRHALIGGGTKPEDAARLIAVYLDGQPLRVLATLALEILAAAWEGETVPDLEPVAEVVTDAAA